MRDLYQHLTIGLLAFLIAFGRAEGGARIKYVDAERKSSPRSNDC